VVFLSIDIDVSVAPDASSHLGRHGSITLKKTGRKTLADPDGADLIVFGRGP